MPPAGRARYCLRRGISRGVAPNPTRMPPAGRAPPCTCPLLKKRDQNFSTEKFLRCEQSAVNIEYIVFARPAWVLFGALFMLFSGRCPDTPTGKCQGLRPRHPHDPPSRKRADEKGRPKLFYGKVFGCEQRAVNIEYSVSARPAIRKGRLNLFALYRRKTSGFAETFSIKYAFAKQKRTS